MHLEILVEDESGKSALEILLPKIAGEKCSFRIIAYKGIGRIPRNFASNTDARKRILLDQLPRLLRGYGQALSNYPADYPVALFVVCDLDDKYQNSFRQELLGILNECTIRPNAYFCFAIEEGEAWFLGDIAAIKKVYRNARDGVLNSYVNDSICGTWECLANAVFGGGSQALSQKGWRAVGAEKSTWSKKIAPHMNVDINKSPSFCYFRDKIRCLLK